MENKMGSDYTWEIKLKSEWQKNLKPDKNNLNPGSKKFNSG
jgi:hypothetical protein